MSGIYGIFRFDGGPVEPETLSTMREAMAYYGPDGGGQWHEGSLGIGHLLLRVTPEDSFEIQPVTKGGVTLVTFARLDNRDELLRTFHIPSADHPTTPDSTLVIEAFLHWGTECTDHINGDWQFAAWDARQRKLFVARDHHGNTALYYHRNSRFIAFASSQKALLALPDVPRKPDMIKMAQILTAWPGEGWRSSHEGINRLPPAHTFLVSGADVSVKRYWFPENLPLIYRKNEQDYVDEFLDIYRQAVRVRLHSAKQVGVTLSGGLDSGSVTALAAPMLDEEGKTLTAFTSVPLYEPNVSGPNRIGNEWELASATAQMAGNNVSHLQIRAENIGIIEGIKRQLNLQNAPVHGASNLYWIHALLEHSRDRNIGVLLTGQCGNGTVSFAGNGQFLPLLMQRSFRLAIETFRGADTTFINAIKRQIAKPLLGPFLCFARSCYPPRTDPWRGYSAINADFAQKIGLLEMMRQDGHDPTFSLSALTRHQLAILNLGNSSIGGIWHEIGAGYGVDVRDPTIDRRVIEFCLRLPDCQFRWHGEGKRLIRRAMAGHMPFHVLNSKQKGLQAADISRRVLNEIPSITSTLDTLDQSPMARELLDITRLRMLLSHLKNKIEVEYSSGCDILLARGISVGLFVAGDD